MIPSDSTEAVQAYNTLFEHGHPIFQGCPKGAEGWVTLYENTVRDYVEFDGERAWLEFLASVLEGDFGYEAGVPDGVWRFRLNLDGIDTIQRKEREIDQMLRNEEEGG